MVATTPGIRQEVQVPGAGQMMVLRAVLGQDIVLDPAFEQAAARAEGPTIVFEFGNGGQVVLDFSDLGGGLVPNIVLADGTVLSVEEYLASLGGELEPAAGPEAGSDSGGVGEYGDDAGDLIGGVDRLGGLDPRNFAFSFEEPLEAVGTEGGTDVVPPESIPPVLGPVVERVDESSLDASGTQWPGTNAAGDSDSVSGVVPFIPGSSGLDQLFIGGIDVTAGGSVPGLYGTLLITLGSDGGYGFTYTLLGNIAHPLPEDNGGEDGRFDDDTLPDIFTMQVVNNGVIVATSSLTVNVTDDGPTVVLSGEGIAPLRTEDSGLPGGTNPGAPISDTAEARVAFQVVFGADGPKLVPSDGGTPEGGGLVPPGIEYFFGALDGVDSGLRDTLTGQPILLYTNSGGTIVYGSVNPDGSDPTFTLSIDAYGVVTLEQLRPVMHDAPDGEEGGTDDVQVLYAEGLVVNIRAIDGDDDSAAASLGLSGLIAFGDDAPTAWDDTDTVSYGQDVVPIRYAISNVLFLVEIDGQTVAYKVDDYETLFNEMKDPGNPQGFIDWIEDQTGGTVVDYFIKAGQLFYDSGGAVIDPVEEGLGAYLTGNGQTFGGSGVLILEPELENHDPSAVGSGFEGGFASGNVLDNDIAGADGLLQVTGVSNDGGESWENIATGGGVTVQGTFGALTLYSDGTYDYVLQEAGQNGAKDTFSYTVQDGDGDQSTATLTIELDVLGTMLQTVAGEI